MTACITGDITNHSGDVTFNRAIGFDVTGNSIVTDMSNNDTGVTCVIETNGIVTGATKTTVSSQGNRKLWFDYWFT